MSLSPESPSSSSDETEPLPHLEMGLADLPLSRHDEGDADREMQAVERKASMASEASA
jgi:hypothetical protein